MIPGNAEPGRERLALDMRRGWERRGWQRGHCLRPLPNAGALIILLLFYFLSPFAMIWGPKSLPVCNPPAPGLNWELAPGVGKHTRAQGQPSFERGSGRTLGKRGLLLHPTNKSMALLHSAAPNPHALVPNWPLPGPGAAWAWCLPLVLAGGVGVF